MANDTNTVRQRLEALPQELYDEIYDLTFTAQPGIRHNARPNLRNKITAHQRHFRGADSINLFLIDSLSSKKFAASYYGGEGAVFVFHTWPYQIGECSKWLNGLSMEHIAMLRDIRVVHPFEDSDVSSSGPRNIFERSVSEKLWAQVKNIMQFGGEDKVLTDLEDKYSEARTNEGVTRYGPRE